MIWTIGMEYFKNDTGKEFDGAKFTAFEAPDLETAKDMASKLIKTSHEQAKAIDDERIKLNGLMAEFPDGKCDVSDYAAAFAVTCTGFTTGFGRISGIVRGGAYWFHLFIKEELDKRQKTMFDDSKVAEQLETERSFEDIMGEADTNVAQPETYNEWYFNRAGDEIDGVPDFWQVQTGLY